MDRGSAILTIAAITFVLGGMVLVFYDIAGRANVAWTRALPLPLSSDTEAFDIGPDGSLWVLDRESHTDWWQTSDYLVYHVSPASGGPWRLPTTAELFPDGAHLGGPEWIHVDASGRPWLGFSIEPRLLYLTGGRWQWFDYPEEVAQPAATGPAWVDGVIWIQDMESLALYSIDAVTGDFESFRLGPAEYEGFYHPLQATADGALIALRGGLSVGGPTALNRFYLGQWSGWRDLEFGEFHLPEYWEVADVTSDPEGNLYVLVIPYPNCVEGVMRSLVGRWSIDTARWDWRELQHYGDCERRRYRPALVVDPRHRLWLQTTDAVVVYTESPFDSPAGGSTPTILYSTENSGFADGSLWLGPDGRVWALGTTDPLVWIDANAPELPEPLPYWVARFIGFPGSGSILLVVGTGLNLSAAYRARRALGRRKRTPNQSGDRRV